MKWISDSGGQVRTCWQQPGRGTGLRGGSTRRRPGGHPEPERPGKGTTSGVWDGPFSGAGSEGPSCPSSLPFSHILRGGHSAGPASSTANPPLGLWPQHPYHEEQLTEGSPSSCRDQPAASPTCFMAGGAWWPWEVKLRALSPGPHGGSCLESPEQINGGNGLGHFSFKRMYHGKCQGNTKSEKMHSLPGPRSTQAPSLPSSAPFTRHPEASSSHSPLSQNH